MMDPSRYAEQITEALDGPYAFLADLGFRPDGGMQSRENRPAPDVWQDLVRDGLRITASAGGDTIPDPERPVSLTLQLPSTDDGPFGSPSMALATGQPLDTSFQSALTAVLEAIETDGVEAVSSRLVEATSSLRDELVRRRRVADDVRTRWRSARDDLAVSDGISSDDWWSITVRGVHTAYDVSAAVVLDWTAGSAHLQLWSDDDPPHELRDLLTELGLDAALARLDRAERRDPLTSAARTGIDIVREHWEPLRHAVKQHGPGPASL